MNQDYESKLSQKIAWAVERGAFRSRRGQALLRLWRRGVRDAVTVSLIDAEIRHLLEREAAGDLPAFKAAQHHSGQICIGRDWFGEFVWLMLEGLKQGLGIFSSTGGGKTTLFAWIYIQVVALSCVGWAFEGYKRFLRRLHTPLKQLGISSVILRPPCWKWNPLQSDVSDLKTHFARVRDLLTRRLDAGVRGSIILGQGLHALYTRFRNWAGQRNVWPNLFDLCEWVRTAPRLLAVSRDALLDRLVALCASITPQAAAYRLSWKACDLARFNVFFEFDGVSLTARQIFQESLIFSVFQREVEQGVSNGPLKLFIGFEDSQLLFDTSMQSSPGMTPLDELAGIVRGLGIGFCPMAQSTVGFSNRLLANLNHRVMGWMSSAADYTSLGADMGLSAAEQRDYQLRARPGLFVARIGSGDQRHPFLFRAPELPDLAPVTDDEADRTVSALDHLPTVFASEYAHWEPYPSVDITPPTPPAEPGLDVTALRVLETIINQPGKPTAFYAGQARINGKRAAQIRKQLIKAGLVREHTLATSGRGRPAIVLEPTAEAAEGLRHARTNSKP